MKLGPNYKDRNASVATINNRTIDQCKRRMICAADAVMQRVTSTPAIAERQTALTKNSKRFCVELSSRFLVARNWFRPCR